MNQKNALAILFFFIAASSGATFYFTDRTQATWFPTFWGLIGTNLSVIGIFYTIFQIKLLRNEAEIIKTTSIETKNKLTEFNRVAELAKAIKLIQEIQGYARARKHEAGVMRLQELKIIIGLMEPFVTEIGLPFNTDTIVQNLNQLINSMEKDIAANSNATRPAYVNNSLEKILDSLVKIQIEIGLRS